MVLIAIQSMRYENTKKKGKTKEKQKRDLHNLSSEIIIMVKMMKIFLPNHHHLP